jgi:hypothetical protein
MCGRTVLADAEAAGDQWEIAAAKRLMARAMCEAGDPPFPRQPRVLFGEAIDIFERIGNQYELAVTRGFAAMSGIFTNIESANLMAAACVYFEREGIGHPLRYRGILIGFTNGLHARQAKALSTLRTG